LAAIIPALSGNASPPGSPRSALKTTRGPHADVRATQSPAVSTVTPGPARTGTSNVRSGLAGPASPTAAVPTPVRAPSSPGGQVPAQVHPDSGNGTGWIIGGLAAAGIAAWALTPRHPPARQEQRPQTTDTVPVALTGTVTDESGLPVSSAAVELFSKSSGREPARRVRGIAQNDAVAYVPQAYVETDVNGRYSILAKLGTGAHVLILSALDHALAQISVDIASDTQHVQQNVMLRRPDPGATPAPYEQRGIYYATDRQPVTQAQRFDYANAARTAPGVAVGRATISVAQNDADSAQFPAGTYTSVTRSGFGQAVVDDVARPIAPDAFSAGVFAEALRSRSRSIALFIHGYNQSFDDGVRDAAQFQYETGLDAPIVAYSWPSAHDLLKYSTDEDSNSASSNNFVQFVNALKAGASARNIRLIIVAHSMGNRIALRGLEMIPNCADAAVMAAPDVYAREVTTGLPLIRKGVKRVTIYASQTDQALLASNIFHQDYRIGLFEHDPFIVSGMDTIDATAVDTSMLGHSYYLESAVVAGDIAGFLSGKAPQARPHLRQETVENFDYWSIVSNGGQH
jgi:esterase/lipase superfamily enzyme